MNGAGIKLAAILLMRRRVSLGHRRRGRSPRKSVYRAAFGEAKLSVDDDPRRYLPELPVTGDVGSP